MCRNSAARSPACSAARITVEAQPLQTRGASRLARPWYLLRQSQDMSQQARRRQPTGLPPDSESRDSDSPKLKSMSSSGLGFQ